MSDALTVRQTQILKAIIDEYINMAEPVGSESLEKKYNLGVSPATIRNEMMNLTKIGYLRQPHTSAGRIPSPRAMKFYIDQLMEERQMSLADEVKVKEDVRIKSGDIGGLLDEATHELSHVTQSLAVCTLDKQDKIWHAGYSHVFESPEFNDFEATSSLFSFLEEMSQMRELFFRRMTGLSPVEVVFGEELGWPGFDTVGVVGSRFVIGDTQGALAVIGPTRLPYERVIPILRYFRDLIEEIGHEKYNIE
jgi:heat-inducible transcriptional repressor